MKNKIFEDEVENFLYNIKWLRHNARLTQTAMAKRLGISIKTLKVIESGQLPARTNTDIIFRIDREFGISPNEQFGRKLGE